MERGKTITVREIAKLIGRTERTIQRRGNKEAWPFIEIPARARGGYMKLYYVDGLPGEIKQQIRMEGEMKKTLEERLEPAAGRFADMTERIFGSKTFDRVCIATGLVALGVLLGWIQCIAQRG